MKKKLLTVATIVICLAILGGGTLAYFADQAVAHNVITSGGVAIDLIEKTYDEDGTLIDFPEGGIGGVMPGTAVDKMVSVKNTGSDSAWIRIRIEEKMLALNGMELPLTTRTGSPAMSYEVDEQNWTLQDGWYYYNEPLAARETTSLLFDKVHFSPGITNEFVGATAHVTIFAQAVQTANNGATVLEAAGWPE